MRIKARYIAGMAPERAVRYVEAYCRHCTRGVPNWDLSVMSPELVDEQRYDLDLQMAGVVASVRARFGGGQRLHDLLLWIHADGKSIDQFRLLGPGVSWPDDVKRFASSCDPTLYIAVVYRLFMQAVDLAAGIYDREVLGKRPIFVDIEERFEPD